MSKRTNSRLVIFTLYILLGFTLPANAMDVMVYRDGGITLVYGTDTMSPVQGPITVHEVSWPIVRDGPMSVTAFSWNGLGTLDLASSNYWFDLGVINFPGQGGDVHVYWLNTANFCIEQGGQRWTFEFTLDNPYAGDGINANTTRILDC